MHKIYIENKTAAATFIGGKLIPPGEGREFDLADVPHELRPATAAAAKPPADDAAPLLELLALPVKGVLAQLAQLSGDQLVLLQQLEEAGAARSTLVAGIGAEQLRRVNEQIEREEAQRLHDALAEAQGRLNAALLVLDQLPALATPAARADAEAAVAEAQAQVDALTASLG